jgi:hypothetical protein
MALSWRRYSCCWPITQPFRQADVAAAPAQAPVLHLPDIVVVGDAALLAEVVRTEHVRRQRAEQADAVVIGRVAGVEIQDPRARVVQVGALRCLVGHVVHQHIGIDVDIARAKRGNHALEGRRIAQRMVDHAMVLRLVARPPRAALGPVRRRDQHRAIPGGLDLRGARLDIGVAPVERMQHGIGVRRAGERGCERGCAQQRGPCGGGLRRLSIERHLASPEGMASRRGTRVPCARRVGVARRQTMDRPAPVPDARQRGLRDAIAC